MVMREAEKRLTSSEEAATKSVVSALAEFATRPQQPPQVTFETHVPEVQVPPVIPPEPPVVHVHTDSFAEAVKDLKKMLAEPKSKRIVRDKDGRITGMVEG